MASNSQSSGPQPPRPPIVGSAGLQNFVPPISMQFRPVAPQQPQSFIPTSSPQFRPVGQGVPNVGVPSSQNQQLQFSQPMQQLPPRPGQPVPSSQAIPVPYGQPNRPITSGSSQAPQNPQPLNNMSGVGGLGMPLSSSYTFAPSYGQPQNNLNAPSQYQPVSQMHAAVIPAAGQPWLPPGSQSTALVTPVQPMAQQSAVAGATVPATNIPPSSTIQSSSDWQEHTSADGRRYYYNKKTRQSSWEKPLELMTPIEIAWQVRRKITTGLYAHF